MFLLLGSTTTPSAAHASTASRICAVDGFIDCPPATTCCTPRPRSSSRRPSPTATATTAVVDRRDRRRCARPSGLRRGCIHLLEEVGDADVARTTDRDAGLDGGADVVGVHVAVPQAVAADHHDRVAEAAPRRLEGRRPARRARRGRTSPRSGGRRRRLRPRPSLRGRLAAHVDGAVHLLRGRAADVPATTWRHAASSSSNPRPPASTTPASRSTGSRSGVLATASRAALGGAFEHAGQRGLALAHRTLDRLGRGAHHREDGALDRAQHRLVRGVGRPAQTRRRRRRPTPRRAARTCRPARAGSARG